MYLEQPKQQNRACHCYSYIHCPGADVTEVNQTRRGSEGAINRKYVRLLHSSKQFWVSEYLISHYNQGRKDYSLS
jgi:hypothetical protein